MKSKKIDASLLNGKNGKYLMTVVPAPLKGVEEALVIADVYKRQGLFMGMCGQKMAARIWK